MIFTPIKINWQGEEATLKPTFEFLNAVESVISIQSIHEQLMNEDRRMTNISILVSIALNHANIKTSKEEVYSLIMGNENNAPENAMSIVWAVIASQYPPVPENQKKT